MRLLMSRSQSTDAPHPGAAAVLDGLAAIVRAESGAGSAAAFPHPAGEVVARARALWRARTGDGSPALCAPVAECPTDAAALAAAGAMAEAGLRATAFLSGAGLVTAHSLLYGIAAKHLPLVVHVADQALRAPTLGELPGHDATHAVADAGWFQLFAWDAQSALDLALIARRIAEQALLPGLLAQEAWLTTHRAMSLHVPTADWVAGFLGAAEDEIPCPTPAQQLLHGERRRRVPAVWSVDDPLLSGPAHGERSYAEAVAAAEPFAQADLAGLAEAALADFARETGRAYAPLGTYRCEDAETVIIAQGSAVGTARALADVLRRERGLRVGVIHPVLLRPFPGARLAALLEGRRGVLVLDRHAESFAGDPPLLAAVRGALLRSLENGRAPRQELPHPDYPRLRRAEELPQLRGAGYGLGGRDLRPAELAAALESLRSQHPQRRRPVLGVEALPTRALTPKQEIFEQRLADAFPHLRAETVPQAGASRTAPALDLLPEGALSVRVFAAQGRAPFTVDDHPGARWQALADLHVQAWPASGHTRRGSPVPFTLVVAPGPVLAVAEPDAVDVVVAVDAAALAAPALTASLKAEGALIVVTDDTGPVAELPWPTALREAVRERGMRAYTLPGHALARAEAGDPAARRRALALLIEGALLACPSVAALTGLRESALLRELKSSLLNQDPHAETADVEAELALLRSGSEALRPLAPATGDDREDESDEVAIGHAPQPVLSPELRTLPPHVTPGHDLHQHWEAHPQYHGGDGAVAQAADPFVGAGVLPAATGLLRDLSATRGEFPHWLPERCTGCGACWSLCPDAALPTLVNTPAELLQTGVRLLEGHGVPVEQLPRAVRVLEGKWRERLQQADSGGAARKAGAVGACVTAAVAETLPAVKALPEEQGPLADSLQALGVLLADFPLALTAPFFAEPEGVTRGSGGLLSITLDADHCKACGGCIQACPEGALEWRPQTAPALADLRRRWEVWHALPTTGEAFRRLGEARSEPPGLETLLLDKRAYRALVGGDDADPGASENTVLHLFSAAAEAVLRPAVAEHAVQVEQLIERLSEHIRLHLAVDVSDVAALEETVRAVGTAELTLSDLSRRVDGDRTPIDTAWLARVTGTLAGLKRLSHAYGSGEHGRPRAALGMVVALNESTAPLAAYPYNPFVVPVSAHVPGGAPGAVLGAAGGHLALLARGFRLVRTAELELAGKYTPELHDPFFARFGWRDFSAAEWRLCPPVVLLGDDVAFGAAGAGAVLDLLGAGLPLKVLCLDGQAYGALAVHTGAPPPLGEVEPGLDDAALQPAPALPALALAALGQGTAYVEQGSLADVPRLLQGFLRGLAAPRPALFSVYRASLPADGQADALAARQSRLALNSRAHPALRYDPDAGATLHERLSLAGNPQPGVAWPVLALEHLDAQGHADAREETLTFAHFALAVPALAHHFQPVPPDAGDDGLTPLVDYLALDADERREGRPFVRAVDALGRLGRYTVSASLVAATAQRRDLWRLLRAFTREDIVPVDEAAIAGQARDDVVQTVWRNLIDLAQQDAGAAAQALGRLAEPAASPSEGSGHV